jgi:hypothetical protein
MIINVINQQISECLAGGMCKRWFELIFNSMIINDNNNNNNNHKYY